MLLLLPLLSSTGAQVERLGVELLRQSTASEQAAMDREVLTEELELERRKNRDLPHEIRVAEAHKAEALEAKVRVGRLMGVLVVPAEAYIGRSGVGWGWGARGGEGGKGGGQEYRSGRFRD